MVCGARWIVLGVFLAAVSATFGEPEIPSSGCEPLDLDHVLARNTQFGHLVPTVAWPGSRALIYEELRFRQFSAHLHSPQFADAWHRPAVIVEARSESDVSGAVRWATACHWQVVVRSGGHSYAGLSSCNTPHCLQLDLSVMRSLQWRPSSHTLQAEPGALISQVSAYLALRGVFVPLGTCADVALGGHLQSSAYGMLASSFGSGMDFVTGLRLVLANGTAIAVSDANPRTRALFRAVLGGTPGAFGVITQFTLQPVPARAFPHAHLLAYHFRLASNSSEELLEQLVQHAAWLARDQNNRGLRDVSLTIMAGRVGAPYAPLAAVLALGEAVSEGWVGLTAPLRALETWLRQQHPTTQSVGGISAYFLWSGRDSGSLAPFRARYITPLDRLNARWGWRAKQDLALPLSLAAALYVNFVVGRQDRYAHAYRHSHAPVPPGYGQAMARELAQRQAQGIHSVMIFSTLHPSTQFTRNAGTNALQWRHVRWFNDDLLLANASVIEQARVRAQTFHHHTRHFRTDWQYPTANWMSPLDPSRPTTGSHGALDKRRPYFQTPAHAKALVDLAQTYDPLETWLIRF